MDLYETTTTAVDRTEPRGGLVQRLVERPRSLSVLAVLVFAAATVVGVSAAESQDLTEVDISGTVTADGGAALSGMKVSVFCTSCDGTHTDPEKDPARPWPVARWRDTGTTLLGETTTGQTGNWSLTVGRTSGSDTVTIVWDPDGDYATTRIYPEALSDWVPPSSTTTVALEDGGRLSGTITGDGTFLPEALYLTASGFVDLSEDRWIPPPLVFQSFVLGIIVAADGSYTTPGLPNWHEYYISYPPGLSGRYVEGASFTLGSIVDGEDAEADHELFEYATVSGRVTDGSGSGLSGIRIYASPTGGGSTGSFYASGVGSSAGRFEAFTDSDGNYSYDKAIPGTAFTVQFSSSDGMHATEYYDDKTSIEGATAVVIPRRGDVSNIDAQLAPAGIVSGTVETSTGDAFSGASAYLCRNDNCRYSRSNSEGFFKFAGLAAGTYSLRVNARGSGEPETAFEVAEGTERYFVVVLDGDDSAINEVEDDASDTFEDIADGAYYETAVAWMIRHGITTGCDQEPALFCPDSDLTRAQFVTFLWRASGKPEPTQAGPEVFGDVVAGHFADQAIGWAKEQGVTTGCAQATATTEARFCIDDPVTRGQIATFLYRFVDEPESTSAHGFTDVEQGRFFSVPVAWTAEHMFVEGCSSTSFCPSENADRATAAVFIHGVATNSGSWASDTSDFQYS